MNFESTNSKINRRGTVELTSVMMNQIVDENLMQRYGTSLQVNMGREYQKYLDEKYVTLRKEFDKINKDLDEGIDSDELTVFLNTYSTEVKLVLP
jgi:hypothetical protein